MEIRANLPHYTSVFLYLTSVLYIQYIYVQVIIEGNKGMNTGRDIAYITYNRDRERERESNTPKVSLLMR